MFHEMKKLMKTTGGGLRFIILLILRMPMQFAMTVIQAVFLQNAFIAIGENDQSGLFSACIIFGIASLLIFLYNGTIWGIYAPFVTRIEGRLRLKLFDKISDFSCQRVEATTHGEWITRLNTDVQMPFSQPLHLPHAVNAILQIGASALILWRMNPEIFVWVMLFVVPHIAFNQLLVARAMPEMNKKSLEAKAENTDGLTALITCAGIAALYDGQDYLMKRFEKSSLNLLRANMKIHIRKALSAAVLPLFGMGGYLTLLIVCSAWIADGRFTFGGLTAAFQYRGGVLVGAMMLINCMISIQASVAGIRRVNETMSEKGEGADG